MMTSQFFLRGVFWHVITAIVRASSLAKNGFGLEIDHGTPDCSELAPENLKANV
jgi:hypothetical protein